MKIIPDLKCSNCGQKMEDGCIATTANIRWLENEKKSTFFHFSRMEELVPDTSLFRWSNNTTKALRCTNCHIVIFKY